MAKIKFKIITPEKVVFEKEIDEVTLPTEMGEITVLPNHIPLVSVVRAGELIIHDGTSQESLAIAGGFLEVKKNEVLVLTENAELAQDIDEVKAQEAKDRAQKLLSELKNKEDVAYTVLSSKIEKELARLHVVRKRKSGHQPSITDQPTSNS